MKADTGYNMMKPTQQKNSANVSLASQGICDSLVSHGKYSTNNNYTNVGQCILKFVINAMMKK